MRYRAEVGLTVFGLAVLLPIVVTAPDQRTAITRGALLLLAALGLNVAAGLAGQPSLGQGAFVGLGGYTVAIMRAHAGSGPAVAMLVALAVCVVAGIVVARAVTRMRPAFVALITWLVAWTFSLAVDAFPRLSGGASGIVLAPMRIDARPLGLSFSFGATPMYELCVCVTALVWCATAAAMRRYAPAFSAMREDPAAARAAGIPVERLRTGALVASAAVGGLAGALLVQSAGVADPTAYGPLLSVKLFLVVLIGGSGTVMGPGIGALALLLVSRAGDAIGAATGLTGAGAQTLSAAGVLVLILVAGRRGVAPLLRRGAPEEAAPEPEGPPPDRVRGARIAVEHARARFGGVRALDDVSIDVEPGTAHAIIGPNGSGKTTLLRVIAGALGGRVLLDGADVSSLAPHERVRAGIARTFQRLSIAPDPTALEHVLSGTEQARATGAVRAIVRTPRAREDERRAAALAMRALAQVGLAERAHVRARDLDVGEQRFVQIARALASSPRALLLDEPSAGMDPRAAERLAALLVGLREAGMTIVLVEHDLALVRAVAGRVTVLDAGTVIAAGTPDEVASAAAVRAAYPGLG